MKRVIGIILMCLGWIVLAVGGTWGFVLSAIIVVNLFIDQAIGITAVILAFVFSPGLFLIVPWYAGFGLGEWLPLILSYGGLIIGGIILSVGAGIKGD